MVAMAMPRLAQYLVLLEHWGTNSTALLFAGDEGAPKPAKQQQDEYEGTRQREANLKDARTAAEADSELEDVRHCSRRTCYDPDHFSKVEDVHQMRVSLFTYFNF